MNSNINPIFINKVDKIFLGDLTVIVIYSGTTMD